MPTTKMLGGGAAGNKHDLPEADIKPAMPSVTLHSLPRMGHELLGAGPGVRGDRVVTADSMDNVRNSPSAAVISVFHIMSAERPGDTPANQRFASLSEARETASRELGRGTASGERNLAASRRI